MLLSFLLLAGCSGSSDPTPESLEAALLTAGELPGEWHDYEPPGGDGSHPFCGELPDPSLPEPEEQAGDAWRQDPDHGPFFGQRIERYDGGGADEVLQASKERDLPCEWEEDGVRWRAIREPDLGLGDDGRVFLVINLERPDSFNYYVSVRSGDVLSLAAFNSRTADRSLLEELMDRAWERSTEAGVTG